MLFDTLDVAVQCVTEGDTLRSDNQFVQILPMHCLDYHTRAYVLGDKVVVEYKNVGEPVCPSAILENGGLPVHSAQNDMGGMFGAETPAFEQGTGIAASK